MRRMPSPPRRVLLVASACLVLLAGAGLWLRDSGFFAVERVEIAGVSGPDAPKVHSALRQAARDQTTLHLDEEALLQAVERYPTVEGVELDRDLPNALRITVLERRPVAVITVAGRKVPLAADGRLLEGATASKDLPALAVKSDPGGRLSDEEAKRLLAVVAAAPTPLRSKARRAYKGSNGLTLSMDAGPSVYFGSTRDLAAKWRAAARVLADPTTEGARYVDVRVPDRAAVGGLAPLVQPDATTPGVTPGTTPDPAAPVPTPEPQPSA
jgi:cell division protein FtsQ